MNTIVNANESNVPVPHLPEETESLIKALVAENTRKAYQRALQSLTTWLSGRTLSDALLANYITQLHRTDKSLATVVDMQVAGRWKSSQMPAHYAKAELAERGAIARFKDGKGKFSFEKVLPLL